MKKGLLILTGIIFSFQAEAMGEQKEPEDLVVQSKCREHDHRYKDETKTCIYCAKHLQYDALRGKCEGYLSPLGKCYGDDHFHAATLECMYCAEGFEFNEDSRKCESVHIILAK